MTRRFWIVVALGCHSHSSIGGDLVDLRQLVSPVASIWIQFVLAALVVLWAGLPFLARGWASVVNRTTAYGAKRPFASCQCRSLVRHPRSNLA